MRVIRWVLLGLYIALVGGLLAHETSGGGQAIPILCLVTVVSLAVFIFGAGSKNLCWPIRRPRLIFPVAAAAVMLAILVAALTIALVELLKLEASDDQSAEYVFWFSLAASWVFWAILLYAYTRQLQRFQVIRRLSQMVFAGSLAELLTVIPSHIYVERRGGCFAGIGTGFGILGGVFVLFWSFGPGIHLLFLKQAHQRQVRMDRREHVDSLQIRKFQFGLRAVLLLTLAMGINLGLLRNLWGQVLAAVLVATLVILLLIFFLLWKSRIILIASLLVTGGLAFVAWGQWRYVGVVAVLGIMQGILILIDTPSRETAAG